MHRIARRPGLLLGGLAVLLLVLAGQAAFGQACTPEEKPLVVLLNSAKRFQMSSRKAIRTVVNPKEGVLAIRTIDRDPTTILLVGTAPGITHLELEDVDGFREVRKVLVQPDTEYLTRQLRAALPMSNITVTPSGAATVILNGTVNRIEEARVADQVAAGLGFTVINNIRLDGVQQVQLDVVIARVRRTKIRNFGFNFLQNSRREIFGSTLGGLLPTVPAAPVGTGIPSLILQPTQIAPIIASPPGQTNLFGGLISNNAGFLFFLQALENEGVAKILVQPRLVTKSGQPASLLDGGEQAVPVPAGLGQIGVQFEEFGTRLNFLPLVLGNGRIHLEVEPEVSTLDPAAGVAIAGATVPGRVTQRIHTTVEMESGQTYVIGGLIQKLNAGNAIKVPVLGQIPFLGTAFSTKSYTDDET
jgi:pilus assembly protein CpaC